MQHTICPGRSCPYCMVSSCMKWVTTSWTYYLYTKHFSENKINNALIKCWVPNIYRGQLILMQFQCLMILFVKKIRVIFRLIIVKYENQFNLKIGCKKWEKLFAKCFKIIIWNNTNYFIEFVNTNIVKKKFK